jgi:hypothetical protein
MKNILEIQIRLNGRWAEWQAYTIGGLGEEVLLGDDVMHYHDMPENQIADMQRVFDVLEAIQVGLEDGIPEHFNLSVINDNPLARCDGELTFEQRANIMGQDNGLELPEA